jgi:hypothetical protein
MAFKKMHLVVLAGLVLFSVGCTIIWSMDFDAQLDSKNVFPQQLGYDTDSDNIQLVFFSSGMFVMNTYTNMHLIDLVNSSYSALYELNNGVIWGLYELEGDTIYLESLLVINHGFSRDLYKFYGTVDSDSSITLYPKFISGDANTSIEPKLVVKETTFRISDTLSKAEIDYRKSWLYKKLK